MTALWITLAIALWIGFAAFARWVLLVRPRDDADVRASLALRLTQLYTRFVHHLRVEGLENVPERNRANPQALIFVVNHTAGVDPLLVQAPLPFEVRWVMARDMAIPLLRPVWEWARVILVDRMTREASALRDALRHLRAGGVLGVFPEGGIERPPRQILPFEPGIGLLIRKSRATIVPVVIEGTPQVDPAWASLARTSRSRVRFLEPLRYENADMKPADIAADLRRRFLDATGWPANNDPEPARRPEK